VLDVPEVDAVEEEVEEAVDETVVEEETLAVADSEEESLEDTELEEEAVAVRVALIDGDLVCVALPLEDFVVEDDKEGLPVIVTIPVGVTVTVTDRVFVLEGVMLLLPLVVFEVDVVAE
jgi:hypothetical protein